MKTFFLLLLVLTTSLYAEDFPANWWNEVPRSEASGWEILPQDAAPGEVILSKRTELGIFSNFGATPFTLDGMAFASVEGLWQSLKYPDPKLTHDIRHQIKDWPHTREQVSMMIGFEAKRAGTAANGIYKQYGLKNVNWQNHFFDYVDYQTGSEFHYGLIKRALRAKLDQNPGLWDLLLSTKCLKLRSDHQASPNEPASFRYFEIFMLLRNERLTTPCI